MRRWGLVGLWGLVTAVLILAPVAARAGHDVGASAGWGGLVTTLIVTVTPILVNYLKHWVPEDESKRWLVTALAIALGTVADALSGALAGHGVQPTASLQTGLAVVGAREIFSTSRKAMRGTGDGTSPTT